MKKTATAVLGTLAVAFSFPSQADNHAKPDLNPVELYACTFKEGKGMEDLDKLDKAYAKWAKKNNKDHSSWRIVPVLRGLTDEFHVGYIGSWNTGQAMGAGMDAWVNNDDLLLEYQATIDCAHTLHASMEIDAPNGPPEDGVVWFASCSVAEGSSHEKATAAHKAMAGAMREMGGKGQSWLFYPSLGMGEVEFDYYSVVSFNNLAELGEGWEMYYNQGGWKEGMKMDGITDCDSPRVYRATPVRMGPQE